MSCQDTDHPGAVEASLLVLHLDIDVDGRWHGSLAVLFHYLLWLSSWFMIVLTVPFFLLLKVFMYDLHLYDYYQYSLLLVLLFFFLPFSCCCFFCCCRRKFDGFVAALCTRRVFVLQGSGSQRDDVVILSHSFQVRWTRLWSTIFFDQLLKHHLKRKILFVPNAQKIT